MTTTYKKILTIALPAMAENTLQMLMGMVDAYLVSVVGLTAISGVAVANSVTAIYQALFIALGTAVAASVAQGLVRLDRTQLGQQATAALQLTVWLGLVLGGFSLVFGRGLLLALGAEPNVADLGGTYLTWVGGSSVLLGLMTTLGALLRATGQAKTPMWVNLLTNLLNVLFSAVGVFYLEIGVMGVALGTVLARLIGTLVLWHRLQLPLAHPSWSWDGALLRQALPMAGERLMMRAGDLVLMTLIVRLGTAVVAGHAIGETLTQFNYMPGLGVATATVILVAQAAGRSDQAEVACLLRAAYVLAFGFMALIAGGCYLLGGALTQLYTTDVTAFAASRLVTGFSLLGTPVTAGTLIYTALWQGLGRTQLPFYATTLGMWLVRLLVGWLLVTWTPLGLAGIWLATLLDNLWRWAFLAWHYRQYPPSSLS